MIPRLVRPRSERMIAGVCGGLGLYFGVDPVIMRLLFVVLALSTTGLTLILYPILWLIMPEASDAKVLPPGARFDPQTGEPLPADPMAGHATVPLTDADPLPTAAASPRSHILALVLVGVGAMLLLDNLGRFFGVALSSVVIPVILVGLGVYLLRGNRTPMS